MKPDENLNGPLRMLAAFDQAQQGTKHLAVLLASYGRQLMTEGYSAKQSFVLVRDYQRILLQNMKQQ